MPSSSTLSLFGSGSPKHSSPSFLSSTGIPITINRREHHRAATASDREGRERGSRRRWSWEEGNRGAAVLAMTWYRFDHYEQWRGWWCWEDEDGERWRVSYDRSEFGGSQIWVFSSSGFSSELSCFILWVFGWFLLLGSRGGCTITEPPPRYVKFEFLLAISSLFWNLSKQHVSPLDTTQSIKEQIKTLGAFSIG